ncbi:MAG: hypothetical protein ACYCOU_21815 [Sulfobacillus sp.]
MSGFKTEQIEEVLYCPVCDNVAHCLGIMGLYNVQCSACGRTTAMYPNVLAAKAAWRQDLAVRP